MDNLIKKIIIVGRDADAWITALLLKNLCSGIEQEPEIELIELPPDLTEQDFFSVLPTHKILHKMLGANERGVLKAADGHFSFGQRFSNWCDGSAPFMHAYDRFGVDFNDIDFYQYWLKATSAGLNVKLEDFNLGAVAAKQQKYVVFNRAAKTFSQASCGYHFGAIQYVKSIAKAAMAQGLKHTQSHIKSVNKTGEIIKSITLGDDREVSADFFIDASGAEAVLIKEVEENNILSWTHWLPADRIMVASASALKSQPSYSQISAFSGGWYGIYPLLNRTAFNFVYSTTYLSSDDLVKHASSIVGMTINDVTDSPFSAGTRKEYWIGNCLAVGASAVSLEPLDAVQLHPLHFGLSLLRNLFPNNKQSMPEATIYNRKMAGFVENIRDFQIAHYYLNKRFNDPYWNNIRKMEIPESLKMKIDLFSARGIISLSEDETFLQENWTALFVGQGLKTKHYDPVVDNIPEQDLIMNFQKLLSHIKSEVEAMPNMQAYIEMNLM